MVTSSGIFLIRPDASLVVLRQVPYEKEDLLQAALATYPDVLAGGVTGVGHQQRLLLVRREMGVPKSDMGSAHWSLDHLFLDGDGVPVVVEVKRASDTRIRREVVGQMLDYAANAVRYWPVSSLRTSLDETAGSQNTTGDELVQELRPDLDPEEFWQAVEANLASGRIRMVFVADELPEELVRIIEFLNEQMSPGEVLGVELPQFVGEGLQLLVPRLLGNTATAAATKTQASGTPWNETSFLAEVQQGCTQQELALFERLFTHVKDHGTKFSWGRGAAPGVSGWYEVSGSPTAVWTASTGGSGQSPGAHPYLYFYLPELKKRLTVDDFEEAMSSLASIPEFKPKLEDARVQGYQGKYPQMNLKEVAQDNSATTALFTALDVITGS